jgi:hypothetical protein
MALPWIALGFGVLVASVAWPNTDETQGQKLFLGLWFGLGLAADLGFGAWARHRLLTEFRLAATRRYELLPGFWKRLLSGGGPASVAVPQVQRLENGE